MRQAALPLLVAGIGLWLSFGSVAPPDATGFRIGILPGAQLLAVLIAAALAVAWLARGRVSPRDLFPLYLAGLLWLPWLPGPVPDAFFLWQGPLTWAVWTAIAAALAAPSLAAVLSWVGRRTPRAQCGLAFLLAVTVYVAAAWRMAPVLPVGDEPHYLVIAQSLLNDGDLRIEDNHERREYRAYLDREIRPHFLRRGLDGQIYSIHAPGLPVMVAPAFAIAGHPGVVVFLSSFCAFGGALLWWTVWRRTASAPAAWVAWTAVALATPFFFQAFTVFPDGPAAVLVIVAVSALAVPDRLTRTGWCAACGVAVAALPWLHTRYAGMAGVLLVLLLAKSYPVLRVRSLLLAVPPLVSAIAWLAFFQAIYGTANPTAPYGRNTQSAIEKIPNGLTGLLIDQQFGILPYAPIFLAALAGLWWLVHRSTRFAIELALIVLPYAGLVASYHMWWGGRSSPARFLVPVLPALQFGVVAVWQHSRRQSLRAATIALLVCSAATAVVLPWVDHGARVYNDRDGYSLALDALAPAVQLPLALPSLFRMSWPFAWTLAACWVLPLLVFWSVLARIEDRLKTARDWMAAAAGVLGVWLMAGTALGWAVAGQGGADAASARWHVLREIGARSRVVAYEPLPRIVGAEEVLRGFQIPSSVRRPSPDHLFTAKGVPGGRYQIVARSSVFPTGELSVYVGRLRNPLVVLPLAAGHTGAVGSIELPAGARLLTIAGDAEARASIGRLTLRVERLGGPAQWEGLARDAARYGSILSHFVDDGAFVEPAGFWVRGGRAARVILDDQSEGPGPVPLLVRNGPVPNRAHVRSGAWQVDLDLAPEEARTVHVPRPGRAGTMAVTVRSEEGFRPAEHAPGSRDTRRLGVWVEPGGRQNLATPPK
jgi:hypothetical protein